MDKTARMKPLSFKKAVSLYLSYCNQLVYIPAGMELFMEDSKKKFYQRDQITDKDSSFYATTAMAAGRT